jgi:hypothetical protein
MRTDTREALVIMGTGLALLIFGIGIAVATEGGYIAIGGMAAGFIVLIKGALRLPRRVLLAVTAVPALVIVAMAATYRSNVRVWREAAAIEEIDDPGEVASIPAVPATGSNSWPSGR